MTQENLYYKKNSPLYIIGLGSIVGAVGGYLFWKIASYWQRLLRQPFMSPTTVPRDIVNHQTVEAKAHLIATANLEAGIEKRRLPDGQEKLVLCAGLRNFREPWARDFGFASFGLVELNDLEARIALALAEKKRRDSC